jgi:membrane peptidoglycan carboxypeptidase
VPTRTVLSVQGPTGAEVYKAADPKGEQAVSPEAAFLMSDVLAGNTDPDQNAFWSATLALRNGPKGERRPAAAKTGTADEWRDFSTYGYLPQPKDPHAPALAVGVWMGNSDHSITDGVHAMSLDTAGEVWHAFISEYTSGWPVAQFSRPDGVVQARIDRWSGGAPGPGRAEPSRNGSSGHPAGRQARHRRARAPVHDGLRQLDGQPGEGGAGPTGLAR